MCVVVSLMVAGCGKDAKPERPTVVKVRTTKVQRATGAVGKSYMGTIEEEDGTAVHFNVMGTVVKVYVDEGQFVRKGQALAEVDGATPCVMPTRCRSLRCVRPRMPIAV